MHEVNDYDEGEETAHAETHHDLGIAVRRIVRFTLVKVQANCIAAPLPVIL